MSRRILFLTYYYTPDNSPGAFRACALNEALLQSDRVTNVDVLTTVPNRCTETKVSDDLKLLECSDKHRLERIAIPRIGFGYLGEAVAFLWFAFKVLRHVRGREYDVVLATSSRLMTSLLATWVARNRDCRLYLDIRDLFVVNLRLLFPVVLSGSLQWLFGKLERWAIQRADKVNLVSEGFAEYFSSRYPGKPFSVYTNGVDELFVKAYAENTANKIDSTVVKVLYAGNMGKGQDLENIIPELASGLADTHEFTLIGGGARRGRLQEKLLSLGIKNVLLLPPEPRVKLLERYQQTDVLFLHLSEFSGFETVLPSKLFEYATTGKPILAGVSGYAEVFLRQYLKNVIIFPPGDAVAALEAISQQKLSTTPRPEFIAEFSRSKISRCMVEEITGELLESNV